MKCGLVSASTRDGISMGLETRSQQEAELNPFAEELESAQHRAADAEEKLAALVSQEGEIEEMAAALRREKERYKRVWLLQCEQLKEHDEALALKEEEIATLREIVRTRGGDPGSSPNRTEGTGGSDDTAARGPDDRGSREGSPHRVRRCGRAPPVDPFTGENPEVQLDDWLPALTRASQWNTWNVEELLMQFAGHLRGRALLEWSLLEDEEKSDWDTAVAALRRRLDPGTKVLAAQDFCHAIQGDSESVPDYIRRLEKTFRIAYGRDNLSKETREAVLYGQLHDGLRSDLMHNPAVSGALTYKELCMGARNEELRKAEMKKRRQYRGSDSWNEAGRSFQPKRLDVRARQYVPKRDRNEQQSDRPAPTSSSSQKPQTLETRTCHNCGKVGHLYRDCMSKKKESSSRARYSPSSKQVTSEGTPHDTDDPPAYLQSSDSEEDTVNLIRIHDKGSCPQCARVEIQGVPAWGIIDSGADITIMGKELFKTIASVRKLKKKDFKKPDKYSRQPFTLDGRMELEITFADKVMTTTVYVKMDAADQLLLSEGVCRQLGILQYHPAVRPWEKRKRVKTRRESENPEPTKGTLNEMSETPGQPRSEEQETVVPTVRVLLLHTVNVPPLQRVQAQVKIEGKDALTGPIVFEPTKTGDDSIVVETSLLASEHGIARLELSNPSGFTQCLEGGAALGEAMEAVFVFEESDSPRDEPLPPAPQSDELEDFPRVSAVTALETEEWREQKMMENFEHTIKLPENERIAFCEFLKKHHTAFSLEDNERGETDLIQLEIDTGEASPKKQRPRRMPFALREEVSRQLRKMQDAGVIRPSSSSWASPVVLVRKKDGTYRFCVDYRELNAVTKPDTFPLPRVDDLLDQLGDTRYFSTLDLAAGYWQIKVHLDSQPKTAFVTPQGLHEFQVMPFGLTNAPAVFQRLMQKVLLGLNPEAGPDFVCVYIDDVLVFSKTLED